METYTLNETNPVAPPMKDWAFIVPSSSTLAFYYVSTAFAVPTAFTALTGFDHAWGARSVAIDLPRPRSSAGTLEELYAFDALPDLDALAGAQGITPVTDFEDLLGDSWPEGESVEDFIAAATEGRHEQEIPNP